MSENQIWFIRWVKYRFINRQLKEKVKKLESELSNYKTLLDEKATKERLIQIKDFNTKMRNVRNKRKC